jgi:hypothetical protein
MSATLLSDILKYKSISSFLKHIQNYYIFEVYAKYFLLYDEKLISIIKKVYLYKEIPKELLEKLELSSTDKGIDLIIETFENTYISVQCKHRKDITKKIPWKELLTFENVTLRNDHFEYGILFTNTLKPCKEIVKNKKIKFYMNEQITESKIFLPLLKRELIKNAEEIITPKIEKNITNKILEATKVFISIDNRLIINNKHKSRFEIFVLKIIKNNFGIREIKEFDDYIFLSSNGKYYITVGNLHKLYKNWCTEDENGDELIDIGIFSKRIRRVLNMRSTEAYLLKSEREKNNNGIKKITSFEVKYFD